MSQRLHQSSGFQASSSLKPFSLEFNRTMPESTPFQLTSSALTLTSCMTRFHCLKYYDMSDIARVNRPLVIIVQPSANVQTFNLYQINLFYLDVCLNMCSSAIRYAWFCTSVCIFVLVFQCLSVLFFVFFFLYHVYVEVFFYAYQCIYVCFMFNKDQSINLLHTKPHHNAIFSELALWLLIYHVNWLRFVIHLLKVILCFNVHRWSSLRLPRTNVYEHTR